MFKKADAFPLIMSKNLLLILEEFSAIPVTARALTLSKFYRKNHCRYLLLAMLMVFMQLATSQILCAQRGLEYPLNNRVIINYQDHVVYAEVKTEGFKPKPKDKFYYYWFNSNDIKKTRGGYDGKLLQGKYTEFYINKDLKAKGKFKNGRKRGKWKYWYPNGQFKETIKWRKRGRVGKFKLYNENGNFIKQGKYKNDKLEGVVREIVNGMPTKKRYHNGVEIIKEKKEKKIREKKPKDESTPADNSEVKKEKKSLFRFFKRSKKDSLNVVPTENTSREPASNEKKVKSNKKESNPTEQPEIDKKSKKDKKQPKPNPINNTNTQTLPKEKKPKKKTTEQ